MKMNCNTISRRADGDTDARNNRCAAALVARKAFTLVEIIIVVVILGIIAMSALPMMSAASSVQLKAAANMIASDLEYARSLAVSQGRIYSVAFDKDTETYQILDQTGTVIGHPIKKGFNYAVDFRTDTRLSKVDITDVDFDPGSDQTITFDYLASPYSGDSAVDQLNAGTITLTAGTTTITIDIEPVTGFITMSN